MGTSLDAIRVIELRLLVLLERVGEHKEMRILEEGPVPPEVGGKFGGVASHVWDLSMLLARRGFKVAILTIDLPRPPRFPMIRDGVTIYGVPKSIILREMPSILLNLPAIYRLKKHFKSLAGIATIVANFCFYDYVIHHFKPDIIHVHHWEFGFPFAYVVSRAETPIVSTVHSLSSVKFADPSRSQYLHKLLEANLKLSRNLIFVSDSVRSELNHFYGGYKAKSWVINNPINTSKYHPMDRIEARRRIGLPNSIPVLLFVGHLYKAKGIYVLLEAIKLLRKSETKLKLIIAGEGEEREGILSFIANNHLEDLVAFEGTKQYPDLLYYYNAANLFVLPSFGEGFPLTPLEAMACGTPIIGTDVIPKETIPSQECGLRVPVNDARALADAIRKGIRKKWNTERIIQYVKHFSWDAKITDYEKTYRYVVSWQ
jgi:glycosyltransferase involved in cell wall biosynthesis